MFSIWWKTIFSSFLIIFIGVNIAFTFDVLTLVNPTSLSSDYENYYFGVSSFVDTFKTYFGDGGGLRGFTSFLLDYGRMLSKAYDTYVFSFKTLGSLAGWSGSKAWEIISLLFSLVSFASNIITVVLLTFYVIMYIIYLIAFAFEIVFFIMAFFGGAFKTPLPSTDWWTYTGDWDWTATQVLLTAI